MNETGNRLATLRESARQEAEATQNALQSVWSEHREALRSKLEKELKNTRDAMEKAHRTALARWMWLWKIAVLNLLVTVALLTVNFYEVKKALRLSNEAQTLTQQRAALENDIAKMIDWKASGALVRRDHGLTWIEIDATKKPESAPDGKRRWLVLTPTP